MEKRMNSELLPTLLPADTENNKKPKTVTFDEMAVDIANKEDLTTIINAAVKGSTEPWQT